MLTEMSLKEALKYFMKGRKVLVLNEYDDKSISAERIEDEQLPPRPTGEETGKRNGSSSGEDEQGRKK